MGQEFELKYSATAHQQAAIFETYGPWQTIEMETTYYDTPQRTLSQHHITLRRRMENGVSICTVKTPMPDGARGEWECQCDEIVSGIILLCRLGAPAALAQLVNAELQSVCAARFTRRACTVQLEHATLELALDQGILLGGGREIPLCEVEAELKDGSREAVTKFAGALAAQYGLIPEGRSKFRRAMALAEGE